MVAILLGVVTLVVLVAAFMASKYWHWAHVLVSVLLYFATVGYLILLAQEQSERHKHQKAEYNALVQLEKQLSENDALRSGTKNTSVINALRNRDVLIPDDASEIGGIRELEHQVRMLNRRRGRVWRNARPTSEVDLASGQVRVGFPMQAPVVQEDDFSEQPAAPPAPAPLALQPGAVIYLFGQGEVSMDGQGNGQYLGEFRVLEVAGREALVEPLEQLQLDPDAAERLINSQGPWIVYESMPADSEDLFADYSEEELQALLPAQSLEEYVRDGAPSQEDDDPARLEGLDADGVPVKPGETPVKYRYRRLQRDYAYLFHDLNEEHAELLALIQAATADLQKLEQSLARAEALKTFRQDELQKLSSDLKLLSRDREEIEAYANMLQEQIAKAEGLLQEVLLDNAAIVAELTRAQGDLTPVASGALDVDAL